MAEYKSLLEYDYSGALLPDHGITADAVNQLGPQLEAARKEVVETDQAMFEGRLETPTEKRPLDAGFFRLPERILLQYHENREHSELGRLLKTAKRLRDNVDKVVVLGIGGSYMGARALMEACCHSFHNQMSRAQRGGIPRVFFDGNNFDNDTSGDLLELLNADEWSADVSDRWALIPISKSGGTLETAIAFRTYVASLSKAAGQDASQYIVPVTGSGGKLYDMATEELGCPELFEVPDGVGGRFSVFSPVGLLPAAVLGLDIVQLLEGAVEMTNHFCSAAPSDNLVLNYTAVSHLMYAQQKANLRVLSVWSNSLEATGLWYDQLLAESLGKREQGATPFTVLNTRDLHSRAQQHQEGSRDKLITNVIVRNWRRDPITVEPTPGDHDSLNGIAGKSLPEIMNAAVAGTNDAYREDSRPTTNLYLPAVNEASLGQLMQMMMLATVVEGRLTGINPYGQPGVEAYKRHMKKYLGLA